MVLLNKKGQIEMADLAGFILIFVAVLIFGTIFIKAAPLAKIELLESETTNYLVKNDLINYLNYQEDGKNIFDRIILKDWNYVEEKTKEIVQCDDMVNRWVIIYKDGEVLRDIELPCSYFTDKANEIKYTARKDLGSGIIVEFTTLYSSFWGVI